jgi:hypothetical protein
MRMLLVAQSEFTFYPGGLHVGPNSLDQLGVEDLESAHGRPVLGLKYNRRLPCIKKAD